MRKLTTLSAILMFAALSQRPASAQITQTNPSGPETDYSTIITTTPMQVLPAISGQRFWSRILNAGSASAGILWCSRKLTTTLAPNAAGSFSIGPTGNAGSYSTSEEFRPPAFVPNAAIWCVSSSGSIPVTAEAAPQ